MTEKDSRIDHYYSLDPKRFSILERFEVRQNHPVGEQPEISLKIELSSPIENEERRLLLSFFCVRGLRFTQEASSLLQLTLITIESIRRDGKGCTIKREKKRKTHCISTAETSAPRWKVAT